MRRLRSAKNLDVPALNDHIPDFLEELALALQSHAEATIPAVLREGSSPAHGLQRVEDGFDVAEVVAEYSILRECIHDLADDHGMVLQGATFHVINRVLDGAIGLAVQTFATGRALEVQRRREDYLAFVAHDLRTPLNAISLAVRVLEVGPAGPDACAKTDPLFKSLRRNVQHLEALVGKVLEENANLQTEIGVKLERRDLDLWPLVEALVYDLHPVAGTDSTRLRNTIPEELVVYADATLLRRIFQNLIANAIRYTPRGEVVVGARELGTGVECWVSDNGAGIPPNLLDKIFEKGATDTAHEGGTGIGLAIVKTFVEAHGGTVTVESTAGRGATVRFTLPARTSTRDGGP